MKAGLVFLVGTASAHVDERLTEDSHKEVLIYEAILKPKT